MERQTRNKMLGAIAGGAVLMLILSRPPVEVNGDVADTRKPEPLPGQNCKGFHGEARNFSGLVQQDLRNPASFEHVETTYGPVDDGIMVATMQYRATNGFGAADTFVAIGEVRADTCAARVLTAG